MKKKKLLNGRKKVWIAKRGEKGKCASVGFVTRQWRRGNRVQLTAFSIKITKKKENANYFVIEERERVRESLKIQQWMWTVKKATIDSSGWWSSWKWKEGNWKQMRTDTWQCYSVISILPLSCLFFNWFHKKKKQKDFYNKKIYIWVVFRFASISNLVYRKCQRIYDKISTRTSIKKE